MRRYPSPYAASFSFGPGPLSTAMKAIIGANVVVFLAQHLGAWVTNALGLVPSYVLGRFWIWQLGTYMFLHGGVFHLLFNMLALWMFGAELERIWGTRNFLKFYFVTGVGAGLLTVLFSLLPFSASEALYRSNVIGASGAIYGLLLAYALYFPNRQIYLYFVFPIPAKIFVLIIGVLAFYASFAGSGGGVANATHLSGIVVAYLYLNRTRIDPVGELKYRYLRWKINRVRRKFDVYSGGRTDHWDRRVH
ncbi:MAG TPA: rhomboid family intramembrane serine protease [Vicinamibacterales bacterium]|jgi:membrane associated rhomboid family serine protease|nr:rhomboid family intramembrane serine protease [Vicinamibacterales bacterium]